MDTLPTNLQHLAESLLPQPLLHALRRPEQEAAAVAAACAHLESLLEDLTPFVPASVVDAVVANDRRTSFTGSYLRGTIILVKLVGCTELLGQLARRGRQGSELTSTIINRVLGELLAESDPRGGEVIRFSGDSLAVFFDVSRLGSQHASLAAAAALAMKRRMDAFVASPAYDAPVQLQLRIAVHSGNFFVSEVGDQSHKEFLITGRAAGRLTLARDSAPLGQVVVSDETLQLLHAPQMQWRMAGAHVLEALSVEPTLPTLTTPLPSLSRGTEALAQLLEQVSALRPYVPFGLPKRFTHFETAGEFRPVTVAVVSFYAFKRLLDFLEMAAIVEQDVAIVGQLINTYYTASQELVHSYGGSIGAVEMSASGDRMITLFGAPRAHEDDPRRAVAMAMDMRLLASDLNDRVTRMLQSWTDAHPDQRLLLRLTRPTRQRIGIASGTMFAGLIGTPKRHEYTVIGDSVHLAGRLMAVADEGEVLLGSATYRAVQPHLEAETLPPIMFKELTTPVPVFRANHLRALPLAGPAPRHAPLIGREAQLEQLRTLAEHALTAKHRTGQVVVVTGEAGIGKTRLVDQLWQELETSRPDVLLLRDSCQSYEQTKPYSVVSRLLRQLLQVVPTDDRESQATLAQQQLEQLAPNWSRFAPLLGPLLGVSIEETDLTRALTREQRRDRLHDLIIATLLAPDHQPIAIAIDDLHSIDPSSEALIHRLLAEIADQSILLALIYRPAHELAQPWVGLPYTTTLHIDPLDGDDSMALLAALLDDTPPPEVQPLLERAQGVPLFLEQTVRYLIESRILEHATPGGWKASATIDTASIPVQIEQLITARLDRLTESTREVAQIASVAGLQVSARVLAAAVQSSIALPDQIEELRRAGLLVARGDQADRIYGFPHTLIRDVIYNGLAFTRRRELHARLAATIERLQAANIDEWHALLGRHYRQAEQFDQAFAHFTLAAEQAQVHYANHEALALYHQALDTVPWRNQGDMPPDLSLAAPLYERLGDVLALTGDYLNARENYNWLIGLIAQSDARGRIVQQAALQRKIGSTYEQQGNLEMASEWLAQAATTIGTAADNGATGEHANILSDIGWLYFRRNDLTQAQLYLEQALHQIEADETTAETARLLNRLGGVAWSRGQLTLAQQYVEQSLAASEQSADLLGQARSLQNLGNLTAYRGLIGDSINYYHQAMAINERIGSRRELAVSANNIGLSLRDQGQHQQAKTHLERALQIGLELRDAFLQMRSLCNLGLVLTELGDFTAAENAVRRSHFLAAQLRVPSEQLECLVALAEVALARGDLQRARAEYEEGLELGIETDSEEYGRLQRVEAKIALATGDIERAVVLLAANEALFLQLQHTPEAERTRRIRARITQQHDELGGLSVST